MNQFPYGCPGCGGIMKHTPWCIPTGISQPSATPSEAGRPYTKPDELPWELVGKVPMGYKGAMRRLLATCCSLMDDAERWKRYAQHIEPCRVDASGYRCTCGLDALLGAARQERGSEPVVHSVCPHGCGATFVRLDEHFCGSPK